MPNVESLIQPDRNPRRLIRTVLVFGLLLLATISIFWSIHPTSDSSNDFDFINRFRGGTLVIAGGGPLPPIIRQSFVEFAGGPKNAQLVVIPAYDPNDQQTASLLNIWRDIGVDHVQILHTKSRNEANTPGFVEPIEQATGVWLSGGTQDWLARQYAGTLVEEKLRALVGRGGVIGGSSAGAAAMTKIMIEQGMEEAVESTGFDLLPNAVIDQHFFRRSRLNRLIRLMTSHPDKVAFGIDEGTALVVQIPHNRLTVIGSSYVVAYVPKTDTGEPRFETLKHGDQIDLPGLKSGRIKISSPSDLDSALSSE